MSALVVAAGAGLPLFHSTPALAASGDRVDFNGDGAADYLVGAPYQAVAGHAYAGAVYVHYGASAGLGTSRPPTSAVLTQNTPGTHAGAESQDFFGSTVATGDFNADGLTDLVVGSDGEGVGGVGQTGGISVFYGSVNGLVAAGGFTEASFAGQSLGPGDYFGVSLAVGDFDGRNGQDIAVGAEQKDVPGHAQAGQVYVLYSAGSSGLSASNVQILNGNIVGPAYGDFGSALAAGQVNGSGPDDLVIGAQGADPSGGRASGVVTLLFGATGHGLDTTASTSLDANEVVSHDDTGDAVQLLGMGDTVAIGIGTGGRIIAGAPRSTVDPGSNPQDDAGAIVAIPVVGGALSAAGAQIYDQDSVGWPGGSETGDLFGAALAAGDWTGDGQPDYAIGSADESIGAAQLAGAVEVWNSGSDGVQFFDQNSSYVGGASEAGDLFGWSVAVSDINGDGVDDLSIGVPGETPASWPPSAGLVQVLIGTGHGPLTGVDSQAITAPHTFGIPYQSQAYFGWSLAFNHDGPGADPATPATAGPLRTNQRPPGT